MAAVNTYKATATREGRWWVVEVDGIGVTQGRTVTEAEEMARDLVAVMLDVPAVHDAAAAQTRAAALSRRTVAVLKEAGLTGKDAARILGISPQRV
jgi:hypothetical protein